MSKPTLKDLRDYAEVNSCMIDKIKNPDGWHFYHIMLKMLEHLEEAEKEKHTYAMVNGVRLTRKQWDEIDTDEVKQYIQDNMKVNKQAWPDS